MKKLEVPFLSQKDNVKRDEYKHNSCGIVCVKMILDYAGKESRDLDELIQEGYFVGGTEQAGWNHETLVRVLRNHGVLAYRQEFRAYQIDLKKERGVENGDLTREFRNLGIEKIKKQIDLGSPTMVSVKKGFGENNGDHVVLIIGYDQHNFYVNDPQNSVNMEQPLKVSAKKLMNFWKGLAIIVELNL